MTRDGAQFTALLLAGSRGPADPVASYCGLSHKALADIAGRPMVERVLSTLADTPAVGRIIAVIERPELLEALPRAQSLAAEGRLEITTARPSPSQSVNAVLEAYDPFPCLLTTADHPLLTRAMIEEFVAAIPADVDVAALVAPDRVIQREHPETQRTYLRFSDVAVSGCNLFALPTREGARAVDFWRRMERDRKKPWKMAWSLGPTTLLRFALRRLTLARAAAAVGDQAGVRAAVVQSSFAEAAIDVDKPSDLRLVQRIVAARERAAAAP